MTIARIDGLEVIRLGDKTTHGGEVISASSNFFYEGIPVARVGDLVSCPKCSGMHTIISGSPTAFNGQNIARHGDSVSCGAKLLGKSAKVGSAENSQRKTKTRLFVDLKNEENRRFEEFLPFTISVDPGVQNKQLSGKKPLAGDFEPGTYTMTIMPTPPPGEELGPIPISKNTKFQRQISLSGEEEYISIIVTRKESIEHNIMMTFQVDPIVDTPPGGKSWYEFHAHNTYDLTKTFVWEYAQKYSLDPNLVNAISYIEETHGHYDHYFSNNVIKTILPMNVNIDYWSDMFAAKGLTRKDLLNREINVREGCFMLHRVQIRAKPNTILEVASLYNSHKTEYVSDYGYHVQRAYQQRLWFEPMMQPSSFD